MILDILIQFRTYKIALTTNIEKVFLMVSVQEPDWDVLRFLWFDQWKLQDDCLTFIRVVSGVSYSTFLLNATLWHQLGKHTTSHPETVNKLTASLYVDDIAPGIKDEEEAYHS